MKLLKICDKIIEYCFAVLFFLTPLILTPWNFELFEYNKMMLVYALTIIIAGTWLIKMVLQRRILFQRTLFDLPIFLFLSSQVLSSWFSIDPHVSLFGYYSRFNGGLFSTISYLFLYYAFIANIKLDKLVQLVKLGLLSGLIVSLYGIAEHFGIDKNLWVQDVQNRVFSTLGQPNWLGAYLAIIIPISIGILTMDNRKWKIGVEDGKSKIVKKNPSSNFNPQPLSSMLHHLSSKTILFFYFLLSTFYLCLLYTKSRSGLMGFGLAYLIFWLSIFWIINLTKQATIVGRFVKKLFVICNLILIIATALVGTPWTPSLSSIIYHPSSVPAPTGPALETGGTESGEIRKIVWTGAFEIARHYPFFGTGVETFAFSYYKFRPVAHNLVSEWDFLYNKAHNEYLNYAATTGFVGLGTYLLFIGWFILWSIKQIFSSCHPEHYSLSSRAKSRDPVPTAVGTCGYGLDSSTPRRIGGLVGMTFFLSLALFAGWLSILVTNFFGFSVVVISLYFWLIPAMVVVINATRQQGNKATREQSSNEATPSRCEAKQWLVIILIILTTFYLLLSTIRFWYADVRFNVGYQLSRAGSYQQAYQPFHEAIDANPGEPFYRDELSFVNAMLSVAASQLKESTLSALLAKEAVAQNQKALEISPQNVNFYKTQAKVYYTLTFNQKALESLKIAKNLAPTDPKITYNIALLYSRLGKNQEAIKTLEEAISLKPNYQDARFALALFYHEANRKTEAIGQLEYILKYISPTDMTIEAKLKEWQN